LLALVGVVGPLGYLVLVTVLGLLWDGYDPIRDTQSELGAVDSPYRLVMNVAGFMGVGVSILAFAAAYHRLLRPSLAKTLATGLLVVAGVSMVVVGFFPCDAGCVDVTGTSRLHSVFSMPGAIGLPAAAMLSALVFRSDGRFTTAWQVVSFWLGLAALVSGPLIAGELLQGANGLLQRAGMWPPLLWMMAVSLSCSPSPGQPRRRTQPGWTELPSDEPAAPRSSRAAVPTCFGAGGPPAHRGRSDRLAGGPLACRTAAPAACLTPQQRTQAVAVLPGLP
jgi:hypothetical membrane protein